MVLPLLAKAEPLRQEVRLREDTLIRGGAQLLDTRQVVVTTTAMTTDTASNNTNRHLRETTLARPAEAGRCPLTTSAPTPCRLRSQRTCPTIIPPPGGRIRPSVLPLLPGVARLPNEPIQTSKPHLKACTAMRRLDTPISRLFPSPMWWIHTTTARAIATQNTAHMASLSPDRTTKTMPLSLRAAGARMSTQCRQLRSSRIEAPIKRLN